MKEIIIICSTFVFFGFAVHINAWNYFDSPYKSYSSEAIRPLKLNKTTAYCYHFTWMGGNFNNRTFRNIRNKTCSQYFKDKKVLCINPMVATFEGGEPDIDYILENHAIEATCRVALGQVCVKYTVSNHGIKKVDNSDYQKSTHKEKLQSIYEDIMTYCTQVNVEAEGPMRQGCVQERRGTELIEVCACRSGPGPNGICNAAFKSPVMLPIILTSIFNGLCLLRLR